MKNITLLLLALTISSFAFSQERGRQRSSSAEDRAKRSTEMLAKQLELTAEQKEKILAINLEQAKEAQTRMSERKAEQKANAVAMREARKEHNEKIKDVLTAEQQTKWEESRAKYAEQRRSKFKRGPGMYSKPDSVRNMQKRK